ncbi:hypothetical protein BK784_22105 [Bacillus thuringiensis serovar medellin]|uniref:Uncharacterized protein n=1 Tax=Bacillus thuringiensis subsp. medellin TaxID=79672 RepID=A0A9X6MZS8_BACTV|nr:hypothetical protein [Bacillus thuringiensis]OUB93608.1 hypothetical protein BK784_22105 [Bacillus thuringiensis serovar medellin]
MNYCQNQNEYEILDASPNATNMSNTNPSYPLANDSQAAMKKMNYKDWLNMFEGPTNFSRRAGTSSSIGILMRVLAFAAAPSLSAGIGVAVAIVGTLRTDNVADNSINDISEIINI